MVAVTGIIGLSRAAHVSPLRTLPSAPTPCPRIPAVLARGAVAARCCGDGRHVERLERAGGKAALEERGKRPALLADVGHRGDLPERAARHRPEGVDATRRHVPAID